MPHSCWGHHGAKNMPKQCTILVAIVWYHFGLARCFKSPDICETHTHTYTYEYMTRAHFLSIVGLQLRAFGAQPPSEKSSHFATRLLASESFIKRNQPLVFLATFVSNPVLLLSMTHDIQGLVNRAVT